MSQYTYSNILVPLDLSECSLNALETATSLAIRKKATLIILHIEDEGMEFLPGEKSFPGQVNPGDVISALGNGIQNKYGIRPKLIFRNGAVAPLIIKTCMENNCDLVVMGTHGASGYRDGFIGTNTYNVIKYAGCPILTIPPHKKWNQFNQVVFPVRPVTGALMRYDVVKNFLTPDSQLSILGLSYSKQDRDHDILEEITQEIRSRITEDKVTAKTCWGNGNGIAEDVLTYTSQHHPDMVVVTSSLDVTNKPYFVGPNAQKIINHSKLPVLSIRKFALPIAISN